MKFSVEDAALVKGYLRGKGLTIEEVAEAMDCHRTTISKKLSGASEVTPVDLLEMGEQIREYIASAPKAA